MAPDPSAGYQRAPELSSEWEKGSFYSKWTFSVVNPLISVGITRQLNFEDLLQLPSHDHSSPLIAQLKSAYFHYSHSICGIPRLLLALCSTVWVQFLLVGFYYLLEGLLRIFSTILLGLFLQSLQNTDQSIDQSFVLALVLSLANLLQNFIHHVSFFYSMKMGNNMKIATIGFIYDCLFEIRGNLLQSSGISTGQLVNVISNDVQRFEEWSVFCQYLWEALVEVGLVFVALSFQLNVLSALAGIALIFATLPLQIYIARRFSSMRRDTAMQTDLRVRHMSEVIDGISSVKGYGWEQPFISLILTIRNSELFNVLRAQRLRAINYCLYFCSPHITLFAIFLVYFHLGGKLTLPLVFSTMSFVQILRLDIGRFFTRAIETSSEAYASALRIEKYLNLFANLKEANASEPPLLPPAIVPSFSPPPAVAVAGSASNSSSRQLLLKVKNGSFAHSLSAPPVLQHLNFDLHRGELLMIIGPVGAGKSSLLSSLLGDTVAVNSVQQQSVTWYAPGSGTGSSDGHSQQQRHPRVAYCTQRPWIVATTVKANVAMAGTIEAEDGELNPLQLQRALAGTTKTEAGIEMTFPVADQTSSPRFQDSAAADFKNPQHMDQQLYRLALETCRLKVDLEQWPDGDLTEIGERGVSVSGGQKARIALARAVYSDADVFLLDDPLSAVDAHVGKDLFFECIHNTLRTQRNKGVILVTHQLQNMRYADKILVLSPSGQQVFYGSHEELLPRRAEFPYIEVDGGAGSEEGTEEGGGIAKRRCESDASVASSVVVEEVNPEESPTFAESPSPSSSPSAQSVAIAKANDNANGNAKAKGFIISTEDRAVGSVTSDTYTQYLKSGGLLLGSTALLYAVVGQMLSMLADYWLRWWASETYGSQDHPLYQWIFALLVFLTILVGYHKVELWFYFTNIASKELHLQSLWGVLHSPLSFFVANPTGRILNRFTKDQNQVDELFPSTFFDCFQCVLFCLSSLALVCISIPWLLLGMIPVSYLFLHYRNRYIQSSLEVKRIEAVTRSPIYADFSATLDGLSTLRAFQLQDRLVISFHRALDGNARAWFSFLMTSRWLGYRLDLISSFILIALLFVSVALKGRVDVGLIGFALVYTLSLAGLLQWTVRQSAEVENQMTSVERIRSYGSLPPEVGYHAKVEELDHMQLLTVSPSVAPLLKEKGYSNGSNYQHLSDDLENPPLPLSQQRNPLLSLPSSLSPSALVPGVRVGHVEIRSLEVTYRSDLPPVLRGLTMDIPPGCKVGICGRTGSGKSSLLQALLRLNIVTAGDVLVDGVSLLSLSLEESRGLISLIPQDPHLFSGTVRFNIDPFHQFSDEEIWNALRDAQLSDHLQAQAQALALASEGQQRAEGEDRRGLELPVEEGGRNFSVGQRQLLSLARAIVRRGGGVRVILMDEVTASIDYLTDKAIQETIRTSAALKSATIITVAHRLRTVADSDLIGFIEEGKFLEIGRPYDLLRQRDSQFRRLAEESNEFDELKAIARAKVRLTQELEQED